MAQRITDKLAKSLPAPTDGKPYVIEYDDTLKGFGLRVTKAGARSFILNYRNAEGRERRMTIGTYGSNEWSVERARKRAGELRQMVDRGEDPMGDLQAVREAPTVKDLCDRYEKEHLPSKRESSARDDKAMIAQVVKPKIGSLKVASVDYADVDKIRRAMGNTPYRANRVLALLSKMFDLAEKWKMRPQGSNPCRHVDRYPEEKRERYLTADERVRLIEALRAYPESLAKGSARKDAEQTCNAFRLAMLTGARIGEVMSARWAELDLDKGVWAKPSASTKQKKPHRVPLNAAARQLLATLAPTDDDASEWVFPSGDSHQKDYKRTWEQVRTLAKVPDLRVHDLRHNFASEGASMGLSLPMIGALLGHTQAATTARYTHLFDDPLREASDRIGRAIMDGTQQGEGGQVVELQKGARR